MKNYLIVFVAALVALLSMAPPTLAGSAGFGSCSSDTQGLNARRDTDRGAAYTDRSNLGVFSGFGSGSKIAVDELKAHSVR